MTHELEPRPVITLDFKRRRIRLYQKTLRLIGDPEYILLLVNPGERTMAIVRSDSSDLRAYRIQWTPFHLERRYIELQSNSLMRNLLELCANCQGNHAYRICGECIPGENAMQFDLEKPVMIGKDKGHENGGIQDVCINR